MASNFKSDIRYAEATELAALDTLVALTNDISFLHIEFDTDEKARELQLRGTDIMYKDIIIDIKSVASYRKSFSLELGNSGKKAEPGWICPEKESDTDILVLAFQLPKGRLDNYSYWNNKNLIKSKEDIEEQYLIFLDRKKLVNEIDKYIKENTRFNGTSDLRARLMSMSKEGLNTDDSLKYDMNLNLIGKNDKPSPMYVSVSGRVEERAMNIVCETAFMRSCGAVITEFGVDKGFMQYQEKVVELLKAKFFYEKLMDENLRTYCPEALNDLYKQSLIIDNIDENKLIDIEDKDWTKEEVETVNKGLKKFNSKLIEAVSETHMMSPEKEAKIRERGSVRINEEFDIPKMDISNARLQAQIEMFKQMGQQLYEDMYCNLYNRFKENEITAPYAQEAVCDYKDVICRLNMQPSEYDKEFPDANPKFWGEDEWAEYLSKRLNEEEIEYLSEEFPFIEEYVEENGKEMDYSYLPF